MTTLIKYSALVLFLLGISQGCISLGYISPNYVWGAEIQHAPNTSDQALKIITEGNQRFASHQAQHPHQSNPYLVGLINNQHPLVAILTCADSRITPELIFDQGLGDIFDVRVVGNIADNTVFRNLEYAVEHLHVPLIIVLSHQNCGAIAAAIVQSRATNGTATGPHEHSHNHLRHIIHLLVPAVRHAHGSPEETTKENVRLTIHHLEHVSSFKEKFESEELKIVRGYYQLDTGQVELLSSPVNP